MYVNGNCDLYVFILLFAKGLECLVYILRGMVEWSKELYTDPSTTGLASGDTESLAGLLNMHCVFGRDSVNIYEYSESCLMWSAWGQLNLTL